MCKTRVYPPNLGYTHFRPSPPKTPPGSYSPNTSVKNKTTEKKHIIINHKIILSIIYIYLYYQGGNPIKGLYPYTPYKAPPLYRYIYSMILWIMMMLYSELYGVSHSLTQWLNEPTPKYPPKTPKMCKTRVYPPKPPKPWLHTFPGSFPPFCYLVHIAGNERQLENHQKYLQHHPHP
jgi:hypothetical protein